MVNAKPRGRQFFQNPGPTNIPDRILRAMDRATLDFLSDEFMEIHRFCHAGVRRVLKTNQRLFMYASSGHGAWEASLVNLFAPGDTLLMLESGYFSESWEQMAANLGLKIERLAADWRRGVRVEDVARRLEADKGHAIKAVLTVHNETATGLATPIADVRRAIDGARHPALLLVDTISSLGCYDFRMDAWGVDVCVGGSQKGLMLPTGMSFTGVSDKAFERSKRPGLPRHYWNWEMMTRREPQSFVGTTPVHLFFALEESIKMIEEEGLDAIFARHHRLAAAARAAVAHWGGGAVSGATCGEKGIGGPVKAIELFCADASRLSDSVTTVMVPDGHDANAFRGVALNRFNVSTGGGLGPLMGRVFRIGHMGDLNEPMLLGALATIELAFKVAGMPYNPGGVEAAVGALAA
ncbi:MAG: aminotransferase class V-fold PLP-dependent enzyme [Rhodospirillales bacterium]|nr:aminotransferase class V-fold PLP-dependent enzyme [Rhodospirillales bacterium]